MFLIRFNVKIIDFINNIIVYSIVFIMLYTFYNNKKPEYYRTSYYLYILKVMLLYCNIKY